MPSISEWVRAFIDATSTIQSVTDKARILELVAQVQDMNAELESPRAENRMLKERLAERKKLERIGGACYILEDDGSKTGPVCPECYDRDGIVMLLEDANGGARCSRCKTRYAGVDPVVEGFRQFIG